MAQLQNELAEKEMIRQLRHDNSWMSAVKSKPEWVNNDVIKIPRQGSAPNVLINNTIYPITSNNRTDDFISLSLNKYDTENTHVTRDELYSLPYEKVSDVQLQHRETLEDKTAQHGLFTLSAPAHSATTPVMQCTGPIDPATGRNRMITPDLINYWGLLGKLGVALMGRNKVLSIDHAADLMLEDSARQKTWGMEWLEGKVPVSHAGFRLWVAAYTPTYEKVEGVWTRKAFEAAGGNVASIFFHSSSAVKAAGTVERYAREAQNDPEYRRNTIGFRLWHICVGTRDEGFGALVSPTP